MPSLTRIYLLGLIMYKTSLNPHKALPGAAEQYSFFDTRFNELVLLPFFYT